ncbi:MAG: LrgB family protein [Pseudomonadota bacterium]|nr:LrgB family protein [Pseudomonadota bacterium]
MLSVLAGLMLTLAAHLVARLLGQRWPKLPVVVVSVGLVMLWLWLLRWPYVDYFNAVGKIFDHLLGYVTVALAIPLAVMRFDDLPLKRLGNLLLLATLTGAALPMGLAWLLHLSEPTILAFATRAVTTPIALNIASLIDAPLALVSLIVIVSGLIGAAVSPLLLRNVHDERAVGLALGLAAHAIGTVEAWQRSPVAGRYAAFGMAVNGVMTAIWLPLVFYAFGHTV